MTECHLATCLHNHIVTDIIVHSQRHTGTEFVLVSLIYTTLYCAGGHLGRDKTYEKIAERFFWPNIMTDVKKLVASFPECQKVNDVKFNKETTPLHPVHIHPKVWHRVSRYCNIGNVSQRGPVHYINA